MEGLNNYEKIIIDDHSSYVEFIWAISDCKNYGDKLVVYKEQKGDIKFINYNLFSKCQEGNTNIEVLYISEYIKKGSLKEEELEEIIDDTIDDIKEKANILIKKYEYKFELIDLFPLAPIVPLKTIIFLVVAITITLFYFFTPTIKAIVTKLSLF